MYIDFDEYPTYSNRNSEHFEKINENIQCVHGYAYSSRKHKMYTQLNEESWGMMKTYFPDAKQIKKPKMFFAKNVNKFKKI